MLFNIVTGARYDQSQIALLSLDTDEITVLPVVGADPHYVSSGHLVFGRGDSLLAVPFDPDRLEVTGPEAAAVVGIVVSIYGPGATYFDVSATGTLVYIPARSSDNELVLVDRQGREQPLPLEPRSFESPRFSPGGERIAYTDPEGDIWIYDLERGTSDRLTTDPADDYGALWAPDGESLIFASDRAGFADLFRKPTRGGAAYEVLQSSLNARYTTSISGDGRFLLYSEQNDQTEVDVWVLDTTEPDKPRPLIQTGFLDAQASFSPDGQWIAYMSDESGGPEVYVRPFTGEGRRLRVSADGGHSPLWGPDGSQLFFWSNANMFMSAPISLGRELTAGEAERLFGDQYLTISSTGGLGNDVQYDVAPDGQTFVMIRRDDQEIADMVLVTNWFDELKRLAPTASSR